MKRTYAELTAECYTPIPHRERSSSSAWWNIIEPFIVYPADGDDLANVPLQPLWLVYLLVELYDIRTIERHTQAASWCTAFVRWLAEDPARVFAARATFAAVAGRQISEQGSIHWEARQAVLQLVPNPPPPQSYTPTP